MTDLETLEMIREKYGAFLRASAGRHMHREEVLAGIMMRETRGGTSTLLDVPGPAGRGDRDKNGIYHGHGLCQIDDRWHKEFIASGKWSDPAENIDYGAGVLQSARITLSVWSQRYGFPMDAAELERASVAAYNCGAGNVMKAIRAGADVDSRTAHGTYSRSVLDYAVIYWGILEAAA